MPDILKSAQAQIDDSAQQIGAPAVAPPPADPAPEALNLPYSSRGHDLPKEPVPTPVVPPPVTKKHSNKSLILAMILFLVATLPLAVYFTSQQRQLNDLRGRAQVGPYPDNIEYYGCIKDGGTPEECSKGKNVTVATLTPKPIPNDNIEYYGCIKDGGTPEECSKGKNHSLPNDYKCTSGITCASGYCSPTGKCDTKPITTAGTTLPVGGPITTLAPGTNQCQNGEQNRDQGKVLVCTCAQGCSFKKDDTEGSGGSGWVCDQNCQVYDADKIPSLGSCYQIDFVHQGSNQYCGVKNIQCDGICQTGGTTTSGGTTTTTNNPTATPTPTPTPPPGGTCELIKLYDNSGTDITLAVRDGTKKLALGEEVTIATTKGNATKARFRIQGIADWTENDPSKTTATEYRLTITIPSTLTHSQGTFEVEVFVNGVWK